MAYIGREPLNGFFTRQVIAHDSSTTTFALTHGIGSTSAIIVSVNAVILQPDVGYTLSGGNTPLPTQRAKWPSSARMSGR